MRRGWEHYVALARSFMERGIGPAAVGGDGHQRTDGPRARADVVPRVGPAARGAGRGPGPGGGAGRAARRGRAGGACRGRAAGRPSRCSATCATRTARCSLPRLERLLAEPHPALPDVSMSGFETVAGLPRPVARARRWRNGAPRGGSCWRGSRPLRAPTGSGPVSIPTRGSYSVAVLARTLARPRPLAPPPDRRGPRGVRVILVPSPPPPGSAADRLLRALEARGQRGGGAGDAVRVPVTAAGRARARGLAAGGRGRARGPPARGDAPRHAPGRGRAAAARVLGAGGARAGLGPARARPAPGADAGPGEPAVAPPAPRGPRCRGRARSSSTRWPRRTSWRRWNGP